MPPPHEAWLLLLLTYPGDTLKVVWIRQPPKPEKQADRGLQKERHDTGYTQTRPDQRGRPSTWHVHFSSRQTRCAWPGIIPLPGPPRSGTCRTAIRENAMDDL